MKNWSRYLLGGLIGIIVEYLYRVNFKWEQYIPALICLIAIILIALTDIFSNKFKQT